MEKGVGGSALSDRLLDAVCLLGPMARCREQLAAFRDAGVGLPILVPPIGVEGARTVIKAFFFNDTATTEIYTLSLHDALPIYNARRKADAEAAEAKRKADDKARDAQEK